MIQVWKSLENDPPPIDLIVDLRRSEDGSLWWIEQTPKATTTSIPSHLLDISEWTLIKSEDEMI